MSNASKKAFAQAACLSRTQERTYATYARILEKFNQITRLFAESIRPLYRYSRQCQLIVPMMNRKAIASAYTQKAPSFRGCLSPRGSQPVTDIIQTLKIKTIHKKLY